MPISFEIIPHNSDALEQILSWRNDPITRQFSFHQKPKEIGSFAANFFSEHHAISQLPPLFIIVDNKRVGIISFKPTIKSDRCLLSINIAPQYRRKKIASTALSRIESIVLNGHFIEIQAEVLSENQAALSLFATLNYQLIGSSTKYISEENMDRPFSLFMRYLVAPPKIFIIAEAGVNWRMGSREKDLLMAKTMIEKAASAGANAVKFQLYTAKEVYASNAGSADYLNNTQSIEAIFEEYALPRHFVEILYNHANLCGIEWMCSAFSPEALAYIDPYVKRHKIASYEITHYPLITAAAQTGKPLILSTGASSLEDIERASLLYYKSGGKKLTLMQCTAKYPAPLNSMHLQTISELKRRFHTAVGLSDHSMEPELAPLVAIGLGATVIEKHFTLSRDLIGPDHSFAITDKELKSLVEKIRLAEKMLGCENKRIMEDELELAHFANRAIHAIRDICIGEALQLGNNIDILRPGKRQPGLPPHWMDKIEGKIVTHPISNGDGIQEKHIQ